MKVPCARPIAVFGTRVASDGDAVLRHDADLLRERRAPSRARLHDDRRRRARAAHAPARRGRLLPHGHGRARRAGGAGGREARHHAARARRHATPCASRSSRRALNVTNDFFIRTTDPEHMAKVAEVVQRIHDNGHVYAGHYEGWYCPRCADFKTDSELEEGNRCPIHQIVLEIEKEDNWFFRLSAFQEPLERSTPSAPTSSRRRTATTRRSSFIKSGLRDVSLSRAAAQVGRAGPVGRVAGHLRLDRRAPQLLHGALLRAPGRGPDRALLARRRST